MKLWDKIKDRFRKGVERVAENADLFKKDVFDLEGVPAFRQYYTLFIWVWQAIYKGFYQDWHVVPVRTINNPKGKTRTMATMNAGKMACSQMARYVWNERCTITASSVNRDTNSKEPDPVNEFLQYVLKENRFGSAFGDLLEKAFAMGGGALKEWVEIPKDENSNDAGEGKIRLSYHMAGQFVPTAWDNARVNSAIFINREAKEGYYYSVVEWHKWDGNTYRVTNDLYRTPIKDQEPQNILGWWYPLNMIYPLLSPSTEIADVHQTYFQYIRPFGANYADDNSPLGMSVFAPALDTLHSLDTMFDSLQREFILGKKRIIVPARAMKMTAGPANGGPPQKYFDADDEVWEALSTDNPEDLKVYDNTVEIRTDDHVKGINAELSILCAQIGFDPGVLSFDAQKGMKTATEVISENSKTFGTVKAHENSVKDALVDMVHAIFDLAARYGITWEGKSVESLISGGYDVAVKFDDSIIQDKAAELNQGMALVDASLMSKRKFMTDVLGYTPEEAAAEIAQISLESVGSVKKTVEETRLMGGMA